MHVITLLMLMGILGAQVGLSFNYGTDGTTSAQTATSTSGSGTSDNQLGGTFPPANELGGTFPKAP